MKFNPDKEPCKKCGCIREGERIYLDPHNIKEIQYKVDESFAKLQVPQITQNKIVSPLTNT